MKIADTAARVRGKRKLAEQAGGSSASSVTKRAHLETGAAIAARIEFKCHALPRRVRRSRPERTGAPCAAKRARSDSPAALGGGGASVALPLVRATGGQEPAKRFKSPCKAFQLAASSRASQQASAAAAAAR